MGGMLAWVAWVGCLRGWCASMGDVLAWVWCGWRVCVDGVLAWVAWVACLHCWRGSVGGVLLLFLLLFLKYYLKIKMLNVYF